jgi:hypothetical protein
MAGSSSQVHEEGSATHQGEAELQARDGPATEPKEGDGASTEEEEVDGDTPFEARGEIDGGEVNEEVLRRYEMEADEDECGLEEFSSDDEDDSLVPRTGIVTVSHSYLSILVRMCHGSIETIRFLLAPCTRVH